MPRRRRGGAEAEDEDPTSYELAKPTPEEEQKFRVQAFTEKLPEFAPPDVRKMLADWGDATIVKARICRKPLNKVITKLGQILTRGEMLKKAKSLGYDDLYHVYVDFFVRKPDGKSTMIRIEKNQKVKVTYLRGTSAGEAGIQCVDQPPTKPVTLLEAVKRAEQRIGPRNLWVYDLNNKNCQDFAIGLLGSGNGMITPAGRALAKQNVSEFLPKPLMGATGKITNLANRIKSFIEGKGLSGGALSKDEIMSLLLRENVAGRGLDKACWKGYQAIGMKTKRGRKVPNCVPVKGAGDDSDSDDDVDCSCRSCCGGRRPPSREKPGVLRAAQQRRELARQMELEGGGVGDVLRELLEQLSMLPGRLAFKGAEAALPSLYKDLKANYQRDTYWTDRGQGGWRY